MLKFRRKRLVRLVGLCLLCQVTLCMSGCTTNSFTSRLKMWTIRQESEPVPIETSEAADPKAKADIHLKAAMQFIDLDDTANAAISLTQAIRTYPDCFEARLKLAEVLSDDKEKNQETVDVLNDLLQRLSFVEKSRKTSRLRKKAEALMLRVSETAFAFEDAATLLASYAEKAEKDGRPANALELYRKALDLWPPSDAIRAAVERLAPPDTLADKAKTPMISAPALYFELGDLRPSSATSEKGSILDGKTKWGLPIYNNGETYADGLWAPAPSEIRYDLAGRFVKFSFDFLVSAFKGEPAQIQAIESELSRPKAGTVKFVVLGDGRELYQSDIVSYASGAQHADVDVSNVQKLVLKTETADGSDMLDFAVWANARLYL